MISYCHWACSSQQSISVYLKKIEYGKIKQRYYLLSAYYVLSADLIYLENAVERRSFINVCVLVVYMKIYELYASSIR